MDSADEDAIIGLYERYLARCNEHRFDELGEFVLNTSAALSP